MAGVSKSRSAKGEATSGEPAAFTTEEDLFAYREMLLIRRFEEKAGQMYGMGLIGGFCHLYIGQEAIAVGVQSIKEAGDQVITGYRDHGHMLACGMDAKGVMAELTGRKGGYSRGKGGSMHIADLSVGMLGANGIVGGGGPLVCGTALAAKLRGQRFPARRIHLEKSRCEQRGEKTKRGTQPTDGHARLVDVFRIVAGNSPRLITL